MTPSEQAQQLFDQGYRQVSRKYRTLARLPEGKTGLEALRRFITIDGISEPEAGDHFLRVHSRDKVQLDRFVFAEFCKIGGTYRDFPVFGNVPVSDCYWDEYGRLCYI